MKKLKATKIDDYKGYKMLRIDDGTEWGTRMSIQKALKVARAAEDVVRIAKENGFIEEQTQEQPVAAVADATPDLFD